MSDGKIVSLGARNEEPPLKVIPRDYSECQHRHYDVHQTLQLVYCRDCDALLDPFWVLRSIANAHQQRFYYVDQSRREAAKMEKLVKRQQESRKSARKAEADAREIARLKKTQATAAEDFFGDISIKAPDNADA